MIEEDKRLSKKEILKMYGIDRVTFEMCVKERGLPVIEVSTHSKYVRGTDLLEWEEGLIHKRGLGFNNSKYGKEIQLTT